MTRRDLLALTCGWTAASLRAAALQHRGMRSTAPPPAPIAGDADITLRIAEFAHEIAPNRTVRTIAYNGQVPGPLLRVARGKPIVVEIANDTKDEEIVHWHGFHIAPEVDGAFEEGTPGIPPRGVRRYAFAPDPSGTRWYHSHTSAGRNLRKSTYSGQFGMFVVEDSRDPGAYDREVPILLHEWEPRLRSDGPVDVEFKWFTINGRMLGAGEPIRVRANERVLFRIANASATLTHRLALTGHMFMVTALDGNAVPRPAPARVLELAPGERVDAVVEMNAPGVWILGEVRDAQRTAGMGIVVEYAGRSEPPTWQTAPNIGWNFAAFSGQEATPDPDERRTFVIRSNDDGHHWTINGKSYPRTDPIVVRANRRYRWLIDNQSANDHPMHLHRHRFEVVRHAGQPLSGIVKDVVIVPAWKQVEIDVVANQPGLSLFHCHHQFHMDMGFMALMRYAD